MLVKSKFEGYAKDGTRLYPCDDGGGGSSGASTTVSDLPDWARGTAQKTLAGAEALTFQKDAEGKITGLKPYQQYTGERTAQFTPLQKQAFEGAAGMQVAPQVGAATGFATQAAQQALGTGAAFDPRQASMLTAQAPGLTQYQMGPAERVRADTFGTEEAARYMSPYIEQAMEPQLREARRSSEIQRQADQARAVGMGAFGGSRQAIVEAERQRNLGTQLGDIRARGLQSAYEQAAQQFNQDAARRLQAQQLNQQAGLTVGGQNLQALLGTQQLGAQTGLQAQLANQQAYQQAQQLAEQSRQYGAGLGLQGLQTALQGAGQIGALGGQQFGQQKDILGIQQQLGAQQQQQVQNILGQQYQDFLNQQRYPYQQLEFLSSMVRGTPTGQVQTMYAPQPSAASQVLGAGTSLAGAYLMGGGRFAEGGAVKGKAAGLADLALSKM